MLAPQRFEPNHGCGIGQTFLQRLGRVLEIRASARGRAHRQPAHLRIRIDRRANDERIGGGVGRDQSLEREPLHPRGAIGARPRGQIDQARHGFGRRRERLTIQANE